MSNFFVKKNESFTVTLPLDCSNPENPYVILVDGMEQYAAALQKVPEEYLEFHTMTWRQPSWGMDCFLRELSYTGGNVRERNFSQEQLELVRIRYLLLGTSFLTEANSLSFTAGTYEVLSGPSEERILGLQPYILRLFLAIASRVWDLGVPAKNLLDKQDYILLRDDPDGLQKVSIAKGLITRSTEEKKTSLTGSVKPASAKATPVSPTGSDSSTDQPKSSGPASA